jgi:hypothetical protein
VQSNKYKVKLFLWILSNTANSFLYPVGKLNQTCHHPIARNLRAVQNRAFLTVPFSGSTLGVRVGNLALNLAEAMVALTRGRPLPALEFSNVTLSTTEEGAQAVTQSGVKVYTRFPVVDDKDLHAFCPGTSSNLQIRDIPVVPTSSSSAATNDDDKLSSWAIALMAVLGVLVAAAVVTVMVLVAHEKKGSPLFQPIMKEGGSPA